MLVSASRISALGLAVAREPDVGLLVEQLVDLLGEAHEQLALVAEVEVEGGARDAGARGDPLDVEVGVGRALGEQRLGRARARRPGSPRAWRWGPAPPGIPRTPSPPAYSASAELDTVSSFWSDPRPWPACSTSPPRATSRRSPTSPSSRRPAHDAAPALRAVGAPELGVPRDRLHAGPPRLGGDVRRRARGGVVGPGQLLRRRGARRHAVQRARDGLRGPARGGLPHHPAGRRGAPRPALQPPLRERAAVRRQLRGPPRPLPRRSSTSTTSRSSTSTSSTPTRRSSTTRATSRPRSTSS